MINELYLYWNFYVAVDVSGGEVASMRLLVWSVE